MTEGKCKRICLSWFPKTKAIYACQKQ